MTVDRNHVATLLLAAMLVATACGSADDAPVPQGGRFAEHMHGHLVHVRAIKAGVIAGDLDATREHAVWLSEHAEPAGMPHKWTPYVKEMRQYAAVAAASRDLRTVAVAVSEIARTCGECHRSNGAKLEFDVAPGPPRELQTLKTQMQRHLWASDRMWEGLLGPSDDAWARGTDMLAEVRLTPGQIHSEPDTAAEVEALVQRVKSLGEQGGQTGPGPARSELYGQFLSLCASCHTLTGGGPGGSETSS